jgi:hypothetical protein
LWAVVLLAPLLASAQSADPLEFFETRIRPILANNCYACHTASQLGGLRLDSRSSILKGGKSGPAVVPGQPDESLLIRAILQTDPKLKMPVGGKLKDQEIADLRVKSGVAWPEVSPAAESRQVGIDPKRREFWSFQPLRKGPLPTVRNRTWPRTAIDHHILAKLEKHGLTPAPAADKRTLIRRATFDLTGLPPAEKEIDAFLADASPAAFAKVVDRLLDSPQYGVRWARYWLDVARYGEDDVRGSVEPPKPAYPNAWRYRDWVIEAFNQDLPYPLFVKAQIAGDLMDGKNEKLVAGLGFFGLGPWYYDTADPRDARANERNDRVDALSRGFLGLTVACARCHDHKYDPITIKDYYALAGVFAGTEYQEISLAPADVVARYKAHRKRIADQEAAIKEFLAAQNEQLAAIQAHKTAAYFEGAWKVLGSQKRDAQQVAQADMLDQQTLARWVRYLGDPKKDHPYLKSWNEDVASSAENLEKLVLSILEEKKEIDQDNRVLMAIANPEKRKFGAEDESRLLPNRFTSLADYCVGCDVAVKSMPRDKYVLWRDLFSPKRRLADNTWADPGVYYYSGDELEGVLSPLWKEHLQSMRTRLSALQKSAPAPYPYLHAIADLASPTDLKLHLRGSPYNLGNEVPRRFVDVLSPPGAAPFRQGSGRAQLAEAVASHPLAARVMVNRIWERHFGRGIVATLSNFGQLGDRPTHPELLDCLALRLLEQNGSIKALHREIMLSASYQLSGEKSDPNLAADPENRLYWRANRRRLDVEAIRDALLFVSGNLDLSLGGPSQELSDNNQRRTVYGKVSRVRTHELLALFDFPDPGSSSERRNVTNVPLQRLFFMNSGFMGRQAESLAKRMLSVASDDAARIRKTYPRLYGRDATPGEIELGLEFLRRGRASWVDYAQALLSTNEFIFVN